VLQLGADGDPLGPRHLDDIQDRAAHDQFVSVVELRILHDRPDPFVAALDLEHPHLVHLLELGNGRRGPHEGRPLVHDESGEVVDHPAPLPEVLRVRSVGKRAVARQGVDRRAR
jgi:hypothetical protein